MLSFQLEPKSPAKAQRHRKIHSSEKKKEMAWRQEGNKLPATHTSAFLCFCWLGFSSSLSWLLACNSHVLARTLLLTFLLLLLLLLLLAF